MAAETQQRREVHAVEPRIRLVAYTHDPFGLAVASARTCYASEFAFVGRLTPKGERTRVTLEEALPQHKRWLDEIGRFDTVHERRIALVTTLKSDVQTVDLAAALDAFADLARQRAEGDAGLARSIYEAGHHTPFQHPTFVFALEDVSRNVVESFFHNHTFYNSEQQSQRYVEMKDADVHVPAAVAAHAEARKVYEDAIRQAWEAYHELRERLIGPNLRVMGAIGKVKGQNEKQVHTDAEKKAQEMARYVLPIAAATQMYHTVSGIVLLRYVRMSLASSAPTEAKAVVDAMVAEVRKVDPSFIDRVEEAPRPLESHVEWRLADDAPVDPVPAGRLSVLVNATPGADAIVANALREVTGSRLTQAELLRDVLDPGRNGVWNDTLNTWDHSPALRALRHVHYTFRKRLSLTAYAQDQRHRMVPGSRPQLERLLGQATLDHHTPDIIAHDAQSKGLYDAAIRVLWEAIAKLRALGIPDADACYLLPNATNITFHQSGDLLSFIHKWRLRLCFNAQKEIFDASLEELRQAQAVHPELTKWLGPPCTFVAAAQPPEKQDDVAACCPEGPRWCGVKVWIGFDAAKGKPKRPY